MLKGKKRMLIAGCVLIAVAAMLTMYALLIGFGIINVHSNTLVIRAGTAEKVYDGEALVCEEWSIVHGELKNGHTLIPLFSGSQTAPGQSVNHVTARIVDGNNVDVTGEYRIEYLDGTLSVYSQELRIVSANHTKEYDGAPLVPPAEGWTLESGSLMLGHTLHVTVTGTQPSVGSSENTFTVSITDEAGADVTDLYQVTRAYGKLEILPRSVTVKSASARWKYDGTPLTAPNAQLVQGTLAEGHQLACEFTGVQTEIGTSENFFTVDIVDANGVSVISNYDITAITGVLAVVEFLPHDDESSDQHPTMPELNASVNGSDTLPPDTQVLALQTNVAGPVYLRLQHFGDYNTDNFGWDAAPALTEEICGTNPLQWVGSALLQAEEELGCMSITWMVDSRGILTPYYSRTDFGTGVDDSYIPLGNWDYTVDYIPYNVLQTLTRLESSLTLPEDVVSEEEMKAYRAYVYKHYLTIPEGELKDVIWGHIKGNINPASKTVIQDVAAYIQGVATYNLNAELPENGEDPIVFFLNESNEGVCRHYASAAVMMYRVLGIPARYVVGYMADMPANQLTYVTSQQAHAWVEVYIDGLGWIPVEVTGGSGGEDGSGESDTPADPEELIPLTVRPVAVYGLANGTEYRPTEYRLVGELKENHQFTCTLGGSLSVPGRVPSYVEAYSIVNTRTGEDVTHLYAVETLEGIIQVVEKSEELDKLESEEPVWLVIKPQDVEESYKGQTIRPMNWEYLSNSARLKDGHHMECAFEGELSEIGTAPSYVLSHKICDENGEDVTDQYEVTYQEGRLEIKSSNLYLVIKPEDVFGYPNGSEWSPSQWEYEAGNTDSLIDGHSLECSFAGSLSTYGEAVSTITDYVIRDEQGKDVTDYYNVICKPGRIVLRMQIVIKPKDVQAMYDGRAHGPDQVEYAKGSLQLAENHRFVDVSYSGFVTYPIWPEGNFSSEAAYFDAIKQPTEITAYRIVDVETNRDVSDLYQVVTQPGYVAIRGLEVEVIPENLLVPYDGKNHTAESEGNVTVKALSYVEGSTDWISQYTFETTLNGNRREYGQAKITVDEVRVLDAAGNDVTRAFDISTKEATMQIYARILVFQTNDAEKDYDGYALSEETYSLTSGDLLDGHRLSVQMPSIVNAGSVANKPTVTIFDERTGKDVTDWYYLDMTASEIGTLTVRKVKLVITADSASQIYDPNKPLESNGYTITEGYVVEGETLTAIVTGSQTLPGVSVNRIAWEDVHIYRGQVETTSNYDIDTVDGTLEVVAPDSP